MLWLQEFKKVSLLLMVILESFFSMLSTENYLFEEGLFQARCWWLTPVILATQETEIRRITV
jgi:hypothetical protein